MNSIVVFLKLANVQAKPIEISSDKKDFAIYFLNILGGEIVVTTMGGFAFVSCQWDFHWLKQENTR